MRFYGQKVVEITLFKCRHFISMQEENMKIFYAPPKKNSNPLN